MQKIRQYQGFTIIEIIIAIVIVLILAAIAAALYTPYALKGRRADGINALLSISLAEERYRASNATYGTLAQAYGGVTTSPQGYYTLSVSNVSATSYTITATGVGNQANDTESGTACGTLQITYSSGTSTQSPSACWPS